MSRHYIELKIGERDLLVTLGYDKPLNEFFIIVEALSSRERTIAGPPVRWKYHGKLSGERPAHFPARRRLPYYTSSQAQGS